MDSFKTPKGTELPFLSLKGKLYLQVMHRVVWFREEHPEGRIKTEIFSFSDDYCIFRATVFAANGAELATAHGREDAKHFQDYVEKSETKAIGRALGLCGYGTQFAPEFDEGDRIVDSPTQPKKTQPTPTGGRLNTLRVAGTSSDQAPATPENHTNATQQAPSQFKTKREMLNEMIYSHVKANDIPSGKVLEIISHNWGEGKNLSALTDQQASQLLDALRGYTAIQRNK